MPPDCPMSSQRGRRREFSAVSCPGRCAAFLRCTADPGPYRTRSLERPRISSASLHAAQHPGHKLSAPPARGRLVEGSRTAVASHSTSSPGIAVRRTASLPLVYVPVIPTRRAQCLPQRDGRNKSGHDIEDKAACNMYHAMIHIAGDPGFRRCGDGSSLSR